MKKIIALLLAAILVMSLCACGGKPASTPDPTKSPSQPTDAPDDSKDPAEGEPGGKTYSVGICQLVQHPALDLATEGFIDALTAELGDAVTIDNQNASNDIPMCSTIVNQFVANGVDLIMANATPALQAAAAATEDIPILGTSVTEYGVALGIANFSGVVGGNISGTSDLAPLDQQAAMFKEWFPDVQNIGLVYCSAEANSQYQVDVVKAELEKLGYTATLYSFSDSNDLAAVTEAAVAANDALYLPTDNTCANNASLIDNICRPAGIPIIAGEEGIAKGCGVATLSISYYDIGYQTGLMAAQILRDGADISTMPIQYAPQFTNKFNEEICTALSLTPPEGYVAIEAE